MSAPDFYRKTLPEWMPRSIHQAAVMLRSGEISSVDLTRACLAQIDLHDNKVHAFVSVCRDEAMESALAADKAFSRWEISGPLQGIPIAVKDIIDIAGMKTFAQSLQLQDAKPAPADADVIAKLRTAGAVLIGKTTTHEFAFSVPEDNAIGPAAHNPWKAGHFSGGSSSGSAVAVATGMALGALGTDTAGSVRSPAALCGITGFKPSRSIVSRNGIIPLSPSLDSVGVLANDSIDCDLMTRAIATTLAECETPVSSGSLAGKRIGVVRHFFEKDAAASDETVAAMSASLRRLEALGYSIEDVELPPLAQWNSAGMTVLVSEALTYHRKYFENSPEKYGYAFHAAMTYASTLAADDYLRAKNACRELTREADIALDNYDFLVSAIQRGPAPLIADIDPLGFVRQLSYGIVFNICDLPAVSVPTGWSESGLPLAMQIASRRNNAAQLLSLCALHESKLPQ